MNAVSASAPPRRRFPQALTHPLRSGWAVLDRMITFEVLQTMLAVLGVLVLIIVSKRFLRILARAIEGDVSGEAIFLLLGLKTATAAIHLLPSAVFLAVLITLGRMYRDYEMPVLAAAGAGLARLYRAVLVSVLPMTLLAGVLALLVLPWTEQQTRRLYEIEGRTADIRGIKEGKFAESSDGSTVFYVEEYKDRERMHNIFVQSREHGRQGIVSSDAGYLKNTEKGEQFIILQKGTRYDGNPGTAAFVVTEFDEYGVKISGKVKDDEKVTEQSAKSSSELIVSSLPRDIAEYQKRLAIPLGVLMLSLLAVPLSRLAPRAGVYGNLFAAFFIYIAYENIQRVMQGLVIGAKVPHWLGYSGVYLLMALVTCLLLVRALGHRWVMQVMRGWVGR
ncbi:MAG: LPS export ABC transporter permease LptF [Methylococcaceae bacterium]|nr:MAG: LPS export ABC transporter permease LptF [Methylococcaceae bacterium]